MAEKREIHEITVQALRELICSGGLELSHEDEKSLNVSDLVGKYVIVNCYAFYADRFEYRSPFEKPYLFGVRDELTEAFWWNYDRREERMGTHHCGVEYEVWHVVDDKQEPDKYGLYQRYALEAYLGDFVEEYDIDAIEDAVTVLDYSTGNRYWTMDDEGLAEYIAGLAGKKIELPDYYRVDMEGKGSAHFTEYEQACEFVDYMMHRPLGDSWCTYFEVWACWADGNERWIEDHWRSVFDGSAFHMRDNDALARYDQF